ncbi:FkbM family methyltransferase [Acidiphilium sp. PA]|uniref:FkbM family methyltransferase n=1 Tax=Acidiphilium sp. PA TaxID=2871705 RepID=UPI0022449C90|nr:FkbM family methyltransferase [Acidiphilium sp. PA]MCW8309380.1 FkbM family methyltransferase [Acidiphilium sp. PA]
MSGQSNVFISYSANHEDVLLNRLFGKQPTGFYIDVGAAHPMFENDTKALYDRGWSGINIEPNKIFFEALAAERPRDCNLNIAISDVTEDLLFFEVTGTGLSTCDPDEAERARQKGFEIVECRVKTKTLREVLELARPPAIDLLKIDVEGLEPNVIQSNDWSRFRPRVLVVEATFPETPVRRPDVVGSLLEREGYRRAYFDGLNDYYLEMEFVAPEGAFDTPLNVFDRFKPLAEVQLLQERKFLHEECKSLKQERANALLEISSLRNALNRRLCLEEDLVRAREELSVVRTRMTTLGNQMEGVEAERAVAEAQYAAAEAGRAAAEAGRAAAEAKRIVAEAQYATAEKRIDAILRSTSWRITRPIRAIARPRRTLKILTGRKAD